MGHRSSKFKFDLMGPFMLSVSFLKIIEIICQQLFSQFSKFSPYYFNIKLTKTSLLTLNGELD